VHSVLYPVSQVKFFVVKVFNKKSIVQSVLGLRDCTCNTNAVAPVSFIEDGQYLKSRMLKNCLHILLFVAHVMYV